MSSILADLIIIAVVANNGMIYGVENLALQLDCHNRAWLRELLKRLEANKQLEIVHTNGGRGHKNIIRKFNRNSPGSRRRVRRSS